MSESAPSMTIWYARGWRVYQGNRPRFLAATPTQASCIAMTLNGVEFSAFMNRKLCATTGQELAAAQAERDAALAKVKALEAVITATLAHVEDPNAPRIANQCTLCFGFRAMLRDAIAPSVVVGTPLLDRVAEE